MSTSQLSLRIYYRWLFGRRVPFAGRLTNFIRSCEYELRRGDIPFPTHYWEERYRNGFWDFLHGLEQVPRYSALLGYLQHLKPGASIIDIGCGEGILQRRLQPGSYGRYLGLDLSKHAIGKAAKAEDARTRFITADAETYVPSESFDVIVFNEVLYYFDDPLEVFIRYARYLNRDGIILTSLFVTERSTAILKQLKSLYPLIDEVILQNRSKSWACSVFASPASESRSG